MKTLRFISPQSQYKILHPWFSNPTTAPKKFKLEATSLLVVQEICKDAGVNFELISGSEFLKAQPKDGISLLLEGELEPIFYNENMPARLLVDGSQVAPLIGDKYNTYKAISSLGERTARARSESEESGFASSEPSELTKKIKQPLTIAIRNHKDIANALSQIKTGIIVIKPRNNSYESKNIFIVNRDRLLNFEKTELMNLSDCLMQEYIEDTLYPPQEIRFHFVGRKLCRCLKIVDKNNWAHAFRIENFSLDNLPEGLTKDAEAIISVLTPPDSKDNVTIDFLLTKSGAFFLEANCGCVNSLFVDTKEEKPFLEPIYHELFRRYFQAD